MKIEHDGSGMIGLGHVGMYAKNPASLAEFYRDVMGMQLVGGSEASHPLGPSAFLSSRPGEESHEIAMFSNPELAHRALLGSKARADIPPAYAKDKPSAAVQAIASIQVRRGKRSEYSAPAS